MSHLPGALRPHPVVIGLVAVVLAISSSVGMYVLSQRIADHPTAFGDVDNPDRIDMVARSTRVDTVNRTVAVAISDIQAVGALKGPTGSFRTDLHVLTTSTHNESVKLEQGQWAPDIDQAFTLGGTPTDYPFDRYFTLMEIRVVDPDGYLVPTSVSVYNTDPFFTATTDYDQVYSDGVDIDLSLKRSVPTLFFALFIMVLMLGLALAATIAAYYVLRWRKGLQFSPASMMAGLLFALVPLRNAVPGSPPIGSIIDFTSFFIAEIIISVALISTVVFGHRTQMAKARTVNQGRLEEPSADTAGAAPQRGPSCASTPAV